MEALLAAVTANPFSKECLPPFTKEQDGKVSRELLWGYHVRGLNPAMFQTAWLVKEDPLMGVAGSFYRTVEVRDRGFELHGEAGSIRGNRRLTKARIGDAFNSLRQTEEQRKVIAEVLLTLRQIQTVCFDEDKKVAWTMPTDLRTWNNSWTTLWVDARCERMIEDEDALRLGRWISDREAEGWTFEWPIAEGKLEDMKAEMATLGLTARAKEPNAKVLKEDWAAALGRAQAIGRLSGLSTSAKPAL
jgi:hypothetical protein